MTLFSTINNMVEEGLLTIKEANALNTELENYKLNISFHEPTSDNKKAFYYTYVYVIENGKRKRKRFENKDKLALIKKVKAFVDQNGNGDTSFENVFEKALDNKIRTEAPNPNTVNRIRFMYKAYIDDEIAKTDIKKIDSDIFAEYIQKKLNTEAFTKDKFLKLKGVFNIVFDYALSKEIIIKDPRLGVNNRCFMKKLVETEKRPEKKAFQKEDIETLIKELNKRISSNTQNCNEVMQTNNALMTLFSINSGLRAAELCALKWEDIDFEEESIWVHSQILSDGTTTKKEYYYSLGTKNEKGITKNGRVILLTDELKDILLKRKETSNGNEYVFGSLKGGFTNPDAYEKSLWRLCKKLGLNKTNNHAIRMYYNSYVLIPLGFNAAERAQILGHSIETNLKYYTFVEAEASFRQSWKNKVANHSQSNLIVFPTKKEALETANF